MNMPVAVGEILDGKYRIERVIGAGGMGVVVAATHLELGQLVAMKFLLNDAAEAPDIATRFVREARAAARIPSEHVARVLDVGRLGSGLPYIVMEYLEGHDLEASIHRGTLPLEDAADYLIQACDAMAAAHRLGIVHRDLKPANLFLAHQLDGTSVLKVLDFGISKSAFDAANAAITSAGALVGSPLYMSPEQMRSAKDVDSRTDIWSLGAVLFELLAGRPPFQNDTITGLIADITLGEPANLAELRPDLPRALVAAVTRCLEREPGRRFPDVAELATALAPFAPQRAQRSVERAHRIVGSVPPPGYSSHPPATRGISSAPGDTGRTPSSPPAHVTKDGLATGATSVALSAPVGHGTVPGWTGTGPVPNGTSTKNYALVLVAAVAVATAAWFALRGPQTRTRLDVEGSLAARPAVVVPPLPSAHLLPPAEVTVAPALDVGTSAPSGSANAVETPASASSARVTARPRTKRLGTPSGGAVSPIAPADDKKNGLKMQLK